MIRYNYKAVDVNGNYTNGKITAEGPAELLAMLRSMHLELISYNTQKVKKTANFSEKIKTKDLLTMFIHLEQLDKAGVPILESIAELKDNAESVKVRNLMREVYESIESGSLFSESLAKHPNVFNSVYVALVAAGEKTGHLTAVFLNIIDDLKWGAELKRKTRKATLGPLFGIFVMMIVMGVMMGIVVPKVTGFLVVQSIALPATTRALIAFSNFVTSYWLFIILFFPVTIFSVKALSRAFPEFALFVDSAKLKIPIIGPILTKIDIAKFCQFFAMTFRSGLGVIECLDSASMVIKNKAIKRSIILARQQISDGQSLAKTIGHIEYFPSLVSRMFKIGEESGNMNEALQNVKFFYDSEINDSIDRLVSMIQPILTFVMGGMIGWVTIAVFGPIYGTFSQIK